MNRREVLAASAAAAALLPGQVMSASPAKPTPPVVKKEPKVIEQLGRKRTDDYAWMKDDNWQAVLRDPSLIKADVKAHLTEENAYTKAMLASTVELQGKMFEEMKGRIKEDDSSVPAPDGPWEYYSRFNVGGQHPLYCRRPRGKTDGEQILLDADALAKGKAYSEVGTTAHTADHKLFGYSEDQQGSEFYKIFVKDLESGQLLGTPIEGAYGDFIFSPDGQWLFWTNRDKEGRPDKIFRRPARGGEATLVYEEKDDGMFMGVGTMSSDAFISIGIGNQETSELRLIPAATPTAEPKVFAARKVGTLYDVEHWDDKFVIRTNAGDAVDFKLCTTPLDKTEAANWKDWIGHEAGRFIVGIGAFKDYLVRVERVNANNRIVITNRADKAEHPIAVDEEAYALGVEGSLEFDTKVMRYTYTSPSTPRQWFDYDMAKRTRTLRKTQEIPSGHDASKYEVKRLYAKASDGAQVPITVLKLKSVKLDGKAPLLVYGYGSYGIPQEPGFSIRNLSLVDRGWVWATTHIRGGSDKGWGWFQEGRKFKKKNTFTDFIACTQHLQKAGYGSPAKTVAYGGSAGGLLMGAVVNERPDLYAGIIAAVPFVDVINTMSDTSLPLTPPEWPEWGNPIEDPAAYDYMMSYSPYDNVTKKPYPAVLATGGLSDPRVTYWEPEKWAAKLRDNTTSGNPVLLKINMEAGHGGASGRYDFLKEIAFDYAFAIWAVEKGWTK
ncbi:prolyl oligopeptidase family serine peptidase [Caulobacter sp. SLTY]|uniref:S9 family peptidase n=1 Tax=Caulobacter sp. SLTY TaxID=2683262 RepID=UPI0014124420|nr:S9 family peptidase [Caulobacter sp. SLTY]NBB15259.1 prolyl oligopeptidase family serine peptidase [Caulobacter sp. SLTY]